MNTTIIKRNILENKISFYTTIAFLSFYSCKSHKTNDNAIVAFQNIICDYAVNDSIKIKNVETFLLFVNPTDDTVQVSLKEIHSNYVHIYKNDTFKINFEKSTSIVIPPRDSLGLPCMSIINKKFNIRDSIFNKGFNVLDTIKNKIIERIPSSNIKKVYEFQLYEKWGKQSNRTEL
ncbi:MAG: hypothetical protein K0M56_04055 [Kaistella sp.]|nr:hypothetical protein [Kaistella sp.]